MSQLIAKRIAICITSGFISTFAFGQSIVYKGNPAILKRGYTFVVKAPNEPHFQQLTKSLFIEVYYRPVDGQVLAEVLSVFMPAPVNSMSQITSRVYEINCVAGSAKFKSMTSYDGVWKRDGNTQEMLGSKWEIPSENSFAYFALKLSCK